MVMQEIHLLLVHTVQLPVVVVVNGVVMPTMGQVVQAVSAQVVISILRAVKTLCHKLPTATLEVVVHRVHEPLVHTEALAVVVRITILLMPVVANMAVAVAVVQVVVKQVVPVVMV